MGSLLGILGLFTLLSIALLLSENRSAINLKTVFYGLIFQLIFALFILKTPFKKNNADIKTLPNKSSALIMLNKS